MHRLFLHSIYLMMALLFPWSNAHAQVSGKIRLEVWANQVIIATYTYDYKNHTARFKQNAKLFTAEGWKNYLAAIESSDLLNTVIKYQYKVSAVALSPPVIKKVEGKKADWEAKMTTLVFFNNDKQPQRQYLDVTLGIKYDKSRGMFPFAVTNITTKTNKSIIHSICPKAKSIDSSTATLSEG